jgi:hypothetical protein
MCIILVFHIARWHLWCLTPRVVVWWQLSVRVQRRNVLCQMCIKLVSHIVCWDLWCLTPCVVMWWQVPAGQLDVLCQMCNYRSVVHRAS